jgi:uncharacterized protein GlcG (DUF336 family)
MLTLAAAERYISKSIEKAKQLGIAVTVAVVDE